MKSNTIFKSIPILLCLSLGFCSCSGTPAESTQASSSVETTTDSQTVPETTDTTSQIEIPADVAYADAIYQDETLAVLDFEADAFSNDIDILPLGNNLLIVSSPALGASESYIDTQERTVHLQVYDPVTGETLHETDVTAAGTSAYMVSIAADGRIAVADSLYQNVQFLDETLTVQSKLTVPDFTAETGISSINSLIADDAFAYAYFTLDGSNHVYKTDLSTGAVSVLYTASADIESVQLESVLFDGSVLNIYEYTGSTSQLHFISAADGTDLSLSSKIDEIYTEGNHYYAVLNHGNSEGCLIYGSIDSKRFYHTMALKDIYNWYNFCIDQEAGTLLHYVSELDNSSLQCYDLEKGMLLAKNDLSSWLAAEDTAYYLYNYDSGVLENHLYYSLMVDWEQQITRLILWNPYKEPLAEESYSQNQDSDGSSEINTEAENVLDAVYDEVRASADRLEEAYQVKIKLAEQCNTLNPSDYTYQYLTDIDTIQSCLNNLEEALAKYPDGFFAQLKSELYPEGLVIYLCGTLTGTGDQTLDQAGGITYTDTRRHVLALDCSTGLSIMDFHHETMHVIDYHIKSLYYDSTQPDAFTEEKWAAFNPAEFSYGNDYSNYTDDAGTYDTCAYVDVADPGQIYFVNDYSKISPMEDRAILFQNAMLYELFNGPFAGADCPHIAEKLEYMCHYIRFHFDTEGWPDVVIWEKSLQ